MSNRPEMLQKMRADAAAIFHAALQAVSPREAIHRFCGRENDQLRIGEKSYALDRFKRVFVIGAGKAGASMAVAMEELIADRISEGVVIVKYGHQAETRKIDILEAGHPIPDEKGENGAFRLLSLAEKAGPSDLVICLISGGGSALMPLPMEGIQLDDKKKTLQALLACGATIEEINTIRKHLSAVKGGRLARAVFPARLATLMISDVVGDAPDIIASGPTVPDPTTYKDCIEVVHRYDIRDHLPSSVWRHFKKGAAGEVPESPKPGDPVFANQQNLIIAGNMDALRRAREEALARGYRSLMLSSMIEGETRHVAKVHAAIAKEIRRSGNPIPPPACILTGGETTVTLKGKGKGGRNQEFALAAAIELAGESGIVILSGGTDGTDGPTDAAGAVADPHTVVKAAALSMDPRKYLRNNDAYPFFQRINDLFITGPTQTNVMDLRILLVAPDDESGHADERP